MAEQETTELTKTFVERLRELLELGAERSRELKKPILVSLTEECPDLDPLRVFANSASYESERWFWEQPDGDLSMLGIGVGHGVLVPKNRRYNRVDELWREMVADAVIEPAPTADDHGPVMFSGFSFDPERKLERQWLGYPQGCLMLPMLVLARRGGACTLTSSILMRSSLDPNHIADAIAKRRRLLLDVATKEIKHQPADQTLSPVEERGADFEAWSTAVTRAADAVRAGQFEKVVLARPYQVQTERLFDVPGALLRLRETYPGCYIFAVARHSYVFLGASPEQLVRLRDGEVHTACLAGSIRRGEMPEEDAALGQQLLDNPKDQVEHAVVVKAMREALEPVCSELTIPEQPELMTVSNVHHLHTPVVGRMSNGATLFDLVARLHPTPAVGGYPKEEALAFIREIEPFNRGWYASPIGWIDVHGNGEFLVALRSALVRANRATLFAGCGIVDGSDPEQEYAESEVKLRPMLCALEPALAAEAEEDTEPAEGEAADEPEQAGESGEG
jgi:isochorismate synthase